MSCLLSYLSLAPSEPGKCTWPVQSPGSKDSLPKLLAAQAETSLPEYHIYRMRDLHEQALGIWGTHRFDELDPAVNKTRYAAQNLPGVYPVFQALFHASFISSLPGLAEQFKLWTLALSLSQLGKI